MKKWTALAILMMASTACAFGQAYTVVTANDVLVDSSGSAVHPPDGTNLCFLGTNKAGTAVTYTPQGGSPVSGKVCQTLNSGALTGSLQVANSATVTPSPLYYTITVENGATIYLTIPGVQVAGTVWSYDSYKITTTGTVLGIGLPHIGCNAGAAFTSTTLNPGAYTCSLIGGVGAWATYPAVQYCPTGNAYVVPQGTGVPFCLAPSIKGAGAPTGLCVQNATYFQTDADSGAFFWGCVNGAWQNVSGGGGGGSGITALTGDVVASGPGSAHASLASIGTSGAYYKVNTDSKGRVTSGNASLGTGDLPFTYSGNTTKLATVNGGPTSIVPVFDANGNLAAATSSTPFPGTIAAARVTGLAPSATTDTTNADNITSGTLAAERLPDTIASDTTGNAATATAFAAFPTSCSDGQKPDGVDASGNAIGCTDAGTSPGANLPFIGTDADGNLAASPYTPENVANKGALNGYASLDSGGHIPMAEIPAALQGALSFVGVWNADTNTPTIVSGIGTKGAYYKVSVSGNTTIDGNTDWHIGDMIIFDGTVWDKVDNYEAVSSVAGRTGAVTLSNTDISGLGTMATQDASAVAITGGSGIFTNSPLKVMNTPESADPNPNESAERYYGGGGFQVISSDNHVVGRFAAVQDTGYFRDRGDVVINVGVGGGTEAEGIRIKGETQYVGLGNTNPSARLVVGPDGHFFVPDDGSVNSDGYARFGGSYSPATPEASSTVLDYAGGARLLSIGPDTTHAGSITLYALSSDYSVSQNVSLTATGLNSTVPINSSTINATTVNASRVQGGQGIFSSEIDTNALEVHWSSDYSDYSLAVQPYSQAGGHVGYNFVTRNMLSGATFTPLTIRDDNQVYAQIFNSLVDTTYAAGQYQIKAGGAADPDKSLLLGVDTGASPFAFVRAVWGGHAELPLHLNPEGGDVLIGSLTDDGTNRLQVNGTAKFAGITNTSLTTAGVVTNTSSGVEATKPLAGSGVGVTTGPTAGTGIGRPAMFADASGTIADSGSSLVSVVTSLRYGYLAFGDSNTAGAGYSPAYPVMLNSHANFFPTNNFTNWGVGGTKCAEMNFSMFTHLAPSVDTNPAVTDMIGTNQSTTSTAGQTAFIQCQMAANARAAIAPQNIFAGNNAIWTTSGFSADTTFANLPGIVSTTNGSTAAAVLTPTNGILYVMYLVKQTSGGTFTVTGSTSGLLTDTITGASTLTTQAVSWDVQSATSWVALARFVVPSDTSQTFTVSVSSATGGSNDVTILAIGAPSLSRQRGLFAPKVFMGGVIHYQGDPTDSSNSKLGLFNSLNQQVAEQLFSDGNNVYFVNVRNYVNAFSDMGALDGCAVSAQPGLHVNNCGTVHLDQAFEDRMGLVTTAESSPNFTFPLNVLPRAAGTGAAAFSYLGSHLYTDPLITGINMCQADFCGIKQMNSSGFGMGIFETTGHRIALGFSSNSNPTAEANFSWPYSFTTTGASFALPFGWGATNNFQIPSSGYLLYFDQQSVTCSADPCTVQTYNTSTSQIYPLTRITLAANIPTFSLVSIGRGGFYTKVEICQDATGGHTVGSPGSVNGWAEIAIALAANTAANACVFFDLVYDSVTSTAYGFLPSRAGQAFFASSIVTGPLTATTIAGTQLSIAPCNIAYSTGINLNVDCSINRIVLTGNVTTSAILAGKNGQHMCVNIVQDSTGGWTFAWPANMHGAMTIGSTASKNNQQCFNYYADDTAWIAESIGVINE